MRALQLVARTTGTIDWQGRSGSGQTQVGATVTDNAEMVFDAMPRSDRHNLCRLEYWLTAGVKRRPRDHLLGPEYEALHKRGVIDTLFLNPAAGRSVQITDLGRAVLGYIEDGS